MKNFLRHSRLSENLIAHGNLKTPGRNFLYIFSIVFLFAVSFANAQKNFLFGNNSSNFTAGKNRFQAYTKYFQDKDYSSNHFLTYTSTLNGSWNNAATWGGAGIPGPGDDVIIDADNIVTIDAAGAQARNILINGELDINNNTNLDVN